MLTSILMGLGLLLLFEGLGPLLIARLATDAAAAERATHRAAAPHRRLSGGGRGRHSVGAGALDNGAE